MAGTTQSGFAALAARDDAENEARQRCSLLTESIKTVLVLTSKGLNRGEIADHIGRHVNTVDERLSEGRLLLGVDTNIEAAVMLTRAGLV